MPDFREIVKNGWHLEKDGTTLKQRMKGLVGQQEQEHRTSGHAPPPLSSLRDPNSFGPPPKHVPGSERVGNAEPGRTAQPVQSLPVTSGSSNQDGGTHPASAPTGLHSQRPLPPKPFQKDTTGLSTAHLLPPLSRRAEADGAKTLGPPPASTSRPPALPPRLPPRPPTTASRGAVTSAASTNSNFVNRSAMDKLSAAGVFVPATRETPGQLAAAAPSMPSQGTTLAQKGAAVRTMAALRNDPRSVSMTDARTTAATLDNFRQRHGDQAVVGMRSMGQLLDKQSDVDKAKDCIGHEHSGPAVDDDKLRRLLGKKRPPPPPPAERKPAVHPPSWQPTNSDRVDDKPPSIPFATRPRFEN